MVYQLNLKGFAPAYYSDKDEALRKYWMLKPYFTRCTLEKIPYTKMLAKLWKDTHK